MNAGRDVERLIAGWLVEEAPAHAPDRILADAGRTIDRTKQRRFTVAWREPMIISTGRLLGAAAVVIAAVLGAGLLGRVSAPSGPVGGSATPAITASPSATVVPSASASAPTLDQYRAARDAICTSYVAQAPPINDRMAGIDTASLTPQQRAPKIDALEELATLGDQMTAELERLDVPPALVAEHSANIARYQDTTALLRQMVEKYRAGDLPAAAVIDQAIAPMSAAVQDFERKYNLADCL